MSSQNTVLLQTVFADGVSDTLSDVFVESVEWGCVKTKNSEKLPFILTVSLPHKY